MCSLPCEFLIWHTIFDNLAVNVNFSLSEFIIIFLILSKNTLFKNYDSRIINKYFWGILIYFLRVKNQLKHRKHLIKKIVKFRFNRKKLAPKNNDYFFDFQQIYFHDIHGSIEDITLFKQAYWKTLPCLFGRLQNIYRFKQKIVS